MSELARSLDEARQQLQSGNAEEAARICRKLTRRFKREPEPCFVLAQAEHTRGRFGKAIEAIKDACKRAPDALELHVMHGDLCMQANRPGDAVKVYERLLKANAGLPALATRLASALLEAGDVERALELHEQALAAAPDEALVHYNYGAALKRAHEFERATTHYRRAVELAPEDMDLRLGLGTLLVETSNFEGGREHLEVVVRARPDAAGAWDLLSYANKKLERGEDALASARRLTTLLPQSEDALVTLSAAEITAAQYEGALESSARGLERNPSSCQFLADRSIALSAMGNREEALTLFNVETLLKVYDIEVPTGYDTIADFNAALRAHIESHPALTFSGISLSCHEGATSNELFAPPLGPVGALQEVVRSAAAQYRDTVELPGHPWLSRLPNPKSLNLSGWATRLRSQGYQHGHTHPTAWLSGVYYVSLPAEVGADSTAGWIEFGRSPYWYGDTDQGGIELLQPQPGRLVLFPSFFFHRTIPFESEEERLTIAFDFRRAGF